MTTKISPDRDAALQQKWKGFAPVIKEEGATVFGTEKHKDLARFCPEVSYDNFGYFASHLTEHADEIDRKVMYELHKRGEIEHFDFHWHDIIPLHYTECREYSILATFAAGKPSKPSSRPGKISRQSRWQVFDRDKRTCVYCGRRPPEVKLHVDHRVSVKDGGTDDLDNLVTACEDCNGGKGASSLPDAGS